MKNIKNGQKQKNLKRVAPDAFVIINQESFISSSNGQRVPFNDDISQININGSVDSPPSTASFTIVVPRSEEFKYFKNGKCLIPVMSEIKIFIKGRFYLYDDEGSLSLPKAYQQFHGIITSISDDYSGDQHSLSFQCQDLLYWLKIVKTNHHPSILNAVSTGASATVFASNFKDESPKELVKKLVNWALGGGDYGNKFINAVVVPETFNNVAFAIRNVVFDPQAEAKTFKDVQRDAMVESYWRNRFQLIFDGSVPERSDTNLLSMIIYGYTPPASLVKKNEKKLNTDEKQVTGKKEVYDQREELIEEADSNVFKGQINVISDAESRAIGNNFRDNAIERELDKLIENAAPFGQLVGIDVINSEYQALLDICIICRDYIGYEFFMSLDGTIYFKPPLFNLDVKTYRPFVVKDEDVLSFSLQETDDVITVFSVRGNISQTVGMTSEIKEMGSALDAKLARQFGIRSQQTDMQMMVISSGKISFTQLLAIYAQNQMDIYNSRRTQGTITIIGTPEIKLGFPIYFESRDCYAYVTGINHSFSFGSSFQTTLTVEAFRYKSDMGPSMTLRPAQDVSSNLPKTFIDRQHLEAERKGQIVGTATNFSRVRTVSKARSTDKQVPFYNNQVQNITDYDGYDLIGIISHGADLILDSFGILQPKSGALDLDTSLLTEDITRRRPAEALANMNITSRKQERATVSTTRKESKNPKAKDMTNINVKEKK